jgi:hypothetical protein
VVNRDHVIQSQPNLVWFEGDGCICMEETDFNYFAVAAEREAQRDPGQRPSARPKHYSIRLYALHELGQMLGQVRFKTLEVAGSTATPGVFFGADSPRIILLAERRPEEESVIPPPGTGSEPSGPPEESSPTH